MGQLPEKGELGQISYLSWAWWKRGADVFSRGWGGQYDTLMYSMKISAEKLDINNFTFNSFMNI